MQNFGKEMFYAYKLPASCVGGRGLESLAPSLLSHPVIPLLSTPSTSNFTFLDGRFPTTLFNLLETLLISSLNIFTTNVPHLFLCQSCPLAQISLFSLCDFYVLKYLQATIILLHSLSFTQLNKPNSSCLTSLKAFIEIYTNKRIGARVKRTASITL